ncbi:MAG: GyrI-like domain-containing protein [Ferruginibacter sp.]
MKKIFIALLLFCGLAVIAVYAFIPAKINFTDTVLINVKQTNADRFLTDETQWNKWWPKEDNKNEQAGFNPNKTNYSYKNYLYLVNLQMLTGDSIIIKNDALTINSLLYIIPVNNDSISLQWTVESTYTTDPFKRFKNYLQGKQLKNNTAYLLEQMKKFLENKEKVYGMRIDEEIVKDTFLIATRYSSNNYPTTNEIYDLIKNLQDYVSKNGAVETNKPMLHIIADSGHFKTMVAIPVNKVIPENKKFLFKRMVPGRILVTEVKGGETLTTYTIKTIEKYMNDYHLQSPAIPFQLLITDRSKEADTTKWITKIYYPVM